VTDQTIPQLFDLSGKVAIVTGGAKGIGQGIAFRLAEAGASVMITDIDLDAANETVKQIKSKGGKAKAIRADAGNVEDANKTIQATVKAFDHIDVLVNNAAIYPYSSALDISEKIWDRMFDINLKGVFFHSQFAAQQMIKAGRGGKIINFASTRSFTPAIGQAHYATCKGGIVMLTKSLALELAPYKILVNAVAPGGILTPGAMTAGPEAAQVAHISMEELANRAIPRHILGRSGEPDDIAKVVLFMASSAADYMTGTVVVADAGYLLS
jgi:2-dehydro-3-deoxy-D-gluconate 5-dehydrogenase